MKHSLSARVRSRFVSDSEGGAIVEIAVTLPLVMRIMTGIFSFSMALYQKVLLAEAISNAGHYLATARGAYDPCASAVAAVENGAPGLTASKLTIKMSLAGVALPASCPGAAAGDPSATFGTSSQGETVTIGASYPMVLGVYGRQFPSFTIASEISEVVQ